MYYLPLLLALLYPKYRHPTVLNNKWDVGWYDSRKSFKPQEKETG